MSLSNNRIGATDGLTVKRRIRGQREQVTIREPQAHADYVQSMNGVDRNDRDSADYSTSIQTNRYYLRIWLYMRCMLLYASLQRRVLANVSGEDTTTKITDDMIFRLISE